MLSRPFRGMPRIRLVLLLVVLLAVEAGAGFGLYRNNKVAASRDNSPPTSSPVAVALGSVQASPALLFASHRASFSVRAASLGDTKVTYTVKYSDGSTQVGSAPSDVSGFSSHSFVLKYVAKDHKEQITVVVTANGSIVASNTFSLLLPVR